MILFYPRCSSAQAVSAQQQRVIFWQVLGNEQRHRMKQGSPRTSTITITSALSCPSHSFRIKFLAVSNFLSFCNKHNHRGTVGSHQKHKETPSFRHTLEDSWSIKVATTYFSTGACTQQSPTASFVRLPQPQFLANDTSKHSGLLRVPQQRLPSVSTKGL